ALRVQDDPLRLRLEAVDLREQRGHRGREHVGDVLTDRLVRRAAGGLPDRRVGPRAVPAVRRRERARLAGVEVDRLPPQVGREVAAVADRRRGADRRLRRHCEDVGGLRDEHAGGACARTLWCDVDDHRHLGLELLLHHLVHRVDEAARGVELDHDRVVAALVRAVDLVRQVVGRDRVDVVVELGQEDTRRRAVCAAAGEKGDGHRGQRGENRPQESRFHSRKDSINVLGVSLARVHTGRTTAVRSLRLALLCLLAAPGLARAADATIASQDLPIGVVRMPAAAVAPSRFDLVAFHWQGSGHVLFRTRTQAGRWSGWRRADPEAEDLPDPGSAESRGRRGWRLGNPYWVGPSDRIAYRLVGDVRRLRAWYVWSPVTRRAVRRASMAGSPQIVPRVEWDANEAIRRAPPRYAKGVYFAVVHHTAGTNAYAPAASAAIVRGIELYHVRGNRWNDIGYNFLVDRYGQVFEGRAGGIDRNVIGAQAEGFNTGSVGVAVIGNYQSAAVP